MNETVVGIDVANGPDKTVAVRVDENGKVISSEIIDAPREPAPPVGANAVRVIDEQSVFTKSQFDHIMARVKPPQMDLVGINGQPLETAVDPVINGEAQIHTTPQRPASLPPGVDLTRRLLVNTKTCRGKVAKHAARAQLKEARREQKRYLKQTGYFKQQPEQPKTNGTDVTGSSPANIT
jgi:hypothetical protein